ncbi:MAG: hypothetical protein HY547_04150 [Elusimicrobia bacterium]|nr:hypothetical protein [Elusimicrobiota bacterium]
MAAQKSFEGTIPERFKPESPVRAPGGAHINFLAAVVMPNAIYGAASASHAAHRVTARQKLWASVTPSVQVTDQGIFVSVSGGQPTVFPPELENDPARIAELQEDYNPAGYHTAFIMGGTSMLAGALLEAGGVVSTPEPWYVDLVLNGGSGFALGCTFNQGALSRDIAQGALNGISGWGTSLAASVIFDKPAPDPRYATISYAAIYGLKGVLPNNGNPIFTDGVTNGNWLTNAATDIVFAGLWDGTSGFLAQTLRGRPESKDFLSDLAGGLIFKGIQNAYYGTRIELDPSVLARAERLALTGAGADVSHLMGDAEIRRGGLYFMFNPGDQTTARTWITVKNSYALGDLANRGELTSSGDRTSAVLAGGFTHLWTLDRVGLQLGLWRVYRTITGADQGATLYDDLPDEAKRPLEPE